MSFEARDKARSDYASIEHLVDLQYKGTNALTNLVLAHPGCNTKSNHLDLPGKLKRRARLHRTNGFGEVQPYLPWETSFTALVELVSSDVGDEQ